jgi:hypothetical protein
LISINQRFEMHALDEFGVFPDIGFLEHGILLDIFGVRT